MSYDEKMKVAALRVLFSALAYQSIRKCNIDTILILNTATHRILSELNMNGGTFIDNEYVSGYSATLQNQL